MTAHVSFRSLRLRRDGDVVRAQPARQPLRDDAKQVVSDRVAQRIVDALELIEVEKHDREHGTVAVGGFERLCELFVEARAVRELGDHVEVSEPMNLLNRAGAIGGILDRPYQTDDVAGVAQQRFAEHVNMARIHAVAQNAHVEPLRRRAGGKLHQPAAECAAILLVDELPERARARIELRRVHAEDPQRLTRALDAVACPLPLPASDAGDPLRGASVAARGCGWRHSRPRRFCTRLEFLLCGARRDDAWCRSRAAGRRGRSISRPPGSRGLADRPEPRQRRLQAWRLTARCDG